MRSSLYANLLCLLVGGAVALTDVSEVTALSKFFFSTDGPNWRIKYGWKQLESPGVNISSLDPCGSSVPWYGITCHQKNETLNIFSHVREIILRFNSLTSTSFPSQAIANLTFLETLVLDKNALEGNLSQLCELNLNLKRVSVKFNLLNGEIPSCFPDKLVKVTELALEGNNITGAIPDSFCKMTNLITLGLNNNRLKSHLPDCFGKLSNLRTLFLRSNNYQTLSGSLPQSLCSLSNLVSLELGGNKFTGVIPDCFGQKQHSLELLFLNGNSLSGSLPPSICKASKLREINLSNNPITGPLIECISKLSHLKKLILQYNRFNGTIPDSYCHLSELKKFGVTQDPNSNVIGNITGTIPACISNWTSLEEISLDGNKLRGSIPDGLCLLSQLSVLDFERNFLTGKLPDCIGQLSAITQITTGFNHLTGALPASMCNLVNLQTLSLTKSSFHGTIPNCIGELYSLHSLALDYNQLTGTFPTSLSNLTGLSILTLEANSFSGHLPSSFGEKYEKMTIAYLSKNRFSGSIPSSICHMTSLSIFEAYGNKLSGEIPACFSEMFSSIQTILLQNNNLQGKLPEWWKLPRLQVLYLSNNEQLHGHLPASLFHQQGSNSSSLTINNQLGYVVIEGTGITGSIPSSVCLATKLTSLLLSGNRLTGSVPSCITQLQSLETFHAPSNKLNGHIMKHINNMTSLTHLDLSKNKLSGVVPKSLGDISPQLIETSLYLNQLSCDLPKSVLQWEKSPDFSKFDILEGNWFSCPGNSILTISMIDSKSKGLVSANKDSVVFYSCGSADYVGPVSICISALILLFIIYAVGSYFQCGGFSSEISKVFLIFNLEVFEHVYLSDAYSDLASLCAAISLIGFTAVVVFVPVVLMLMQSPYKCQYMDRISFSGKDVRGSNLLGIIIGVMIGICCIAASYRVWKAKVVHVFNKQKYQSSAIRGHEENGDSSSEEESNKEDDVTSRYQSSFLSDDSAVPLESLNDPLISNPPNNSDNFDDPFSLQPKWSRLTSVKRIIEEKFSYIKKKRSTKKQSYSLSSLLYRLLEFVALSLFLTCSSIGPNVIFVYIMLGDYSSDFKTIVTVVVALFKASLTSLIIPTCSEMIAICLFPMSSFGYRFRIAVNIGVVVSAISLVLGPILIVAFTDRRCLYYHFKPQDEVTGQVSYQACVLTGPRGDCAEYAEREMSSSYTPHFDYSGDECVSAVISTYTPVFLAHVLLSAPVSAAIELILVPLAAPWCFKNRCVNKWAAGILFTLRLATYNVPSLLSITHPTDINEIVEKVDLDRSARSVMRRAYVQFASSLLLVATFGVTSPIIGAASILAALIDFKHQTLVISQLLCLGKVLPTRPSVPRMKHCSSFPKTASFIIVATILLFWIFVTIDNFDEVFVLSSTLIVWIVFAMLVGVLTSLAFKSTAVAS